jgi:hypothetical protein
MLRKMIPEWQASAQRAQNEWYANNLVLMALSRQNKNLDRAERSNAEKWVLYLSAFDFSGLVSGFVLFEQDRREQVIQLTYRAGANETLVVLKDRGMKMGA